ncbi:Zn-ribbon domain-containing OB-fold protein [Roseomonas marmotae]|uniref:Zn-ribbon domain-containing OB-fold protein n=1 Tax=Roseomonas marmotae TaxID=2768161 RepID=A0ABS3KHG5_9PROT|nr:Zn-ribbon domain-containing OB-fold protein [Roseomonas marmotae]MBO1076918.1 Zn-ribbon domain-containing OB-fold protein [Roseomonas marmotae]
MNDTVSARPLPHASELTRPYWEGAAQGKLLIQRCGQCGKLRHYPRYLCDRCHSFEVEWAESSGRGQVHSWTVAHHPFHPAFAGAVPYALVTVDLEEGVRALGRYAVADGAGLRLGLPVRLRMETVAEGVALPMFEPMES